MPSFYEYIVFNIYNFIYKNTYCNFENINIGETIIKIARTKGVLWNSLGLFREDFLGTVIPTIFGLFYFYYKLDMKYFLVFVFYIFILIILQKLNISKISQLNKKKEEVSDHVYEKLVDSFNNISIVHNFNNKSNEINIISYVFSSYKEIFFKTIQTILNFEISTRIINFIVLICVLGYMLIKDYQSNKIDKTKFFQITQVILVLIWKFDGIGAVSLRVAEELGNIYDINDYFKNEIPVDTQCNIGNKSFSNGTIEFKQIYHKYKNSNHYALDNVSLKINSGDKVALVGKSGSGKSTLVKLLLKKEYLIMGNITINNENIKNISASELAQNIFYIPQSPKLFNRSLYDNIVYGLKNPPKKEEIIETIQQMELQSVATIFAEKMDESVGKNGSSLSGGQRQIVWLLRSLYRMKPIVILDEPTAALDPESKKIVINAIEKVTAGKTVIIITHDDVVRHFKQIKFNKGKIMNNDFEMNNLFHL